MSWIVESLLKNKLLIKETLDIESDELNNLLTVEAEINKLYKESFLSDFDMLILELVSEGMPIKEMEDSIGLGRVTISATFIQICDRISFFLGGYFTDEGFLDNMKADYKLGDEEIEKIRGHIQSKFKHKKIRSPK